MNMNELATRIAAEEGLKKQVSIAQIKEILGKVADECWKSADTVRIIVDAGKRRAKAAVRTALEDWDTAAARRRAKSAAARRRGKAVRK